MAATVLSGTSGALYYKPAGTTDTFVSADVDTVNDEITVGAYLGFQVGDAVQFRVVNTATGLAGTGTLPAGISVSTTYYVIAYAEATGILQVSATEGGATITISDTGTVTSPNEFEIFLDDYLPVLKVRSWSLDITRAELDTTSIGQTVTKYAPFRTYIAGFADGNGACTVFVTDEDDALSNRMVEDVLRFKQVGCAFRLYTDKQANETLSRSISLDAVLLSASRSIDPDSPQQVDIAFRPTEAPTFDFSGTA